MAAAPKTTKKTTARRTGPTTRKTASKTTASASKPAPAKAKTTAASGSAGAKTTASSKTPARKTAPARTAASKATASGSTPAAATVVTEKSVIAGPVLKKNDFIDRVVTATGMKKKDVKPVVETALVQLGEAIARGEELNLPGLGKLKINREKDLANARIFICKLRQPKGGGATAPDPLAEAAE